MVRIRKGTRADISKAADIYDEVLKTEECGLASIGWIRGVYPTESTSYDAVLRGDLFVAEFDGKIAASAIINKIQVPEYASAQWKYRNISDEKVMVLHTLTVAPDYSGKGVGSAFVSFYEKYAEQSGCTHLRMDTNEKNTRARGMYARLGYREAGIVQCTFNGIPNVGLVCLEKKLGGDN